MYTLWTNPEKEALLTEAVKNSNSLAQVLKALGLKTVGGNYANLKHHISRLDLDISHFSGQGWNKDNFKTRDYSNTDSLKQHLLRIRGHKCERCLNTEWQGVAIPLELEHCDGNRSNNAEANLKLLCCNCHALTPTWRRRKSVLK